MVVAPAGLSEYLLGVCFDGVGGFSVPLFVSFSPAGRPEGLPEGHATHSFGDAVRGSFIQLSAGAPAPWSDTLSRPSDASSARGDAHVAVSGNALILAQS